MLYDRSYMREPAYGRGLLLTYWLMIANAVVFVLVTFVGFWGLVPMAPGSALPRFVTEYLALSPGGLSRGFVWQLLTFQFLHGGFLHLALNMVVIYFFGRAIEEAIGGRRMLQLYLTSGVVGGLCQVLLGVILPQLFGAGVVGASAGGFALVAAFATLFPDRLITLLLFFVIPVSLRARTLLWISIGLGLFGLLIPSDDVAHAAHLGGIAVGVLFVHGIVFERWHWPKWRMPSPVRRRPRVAVFSGQAKGPAARSPGAEDEELEEDFMSRDVDPILDKISAHGMQSLTERERQILQSARQRMQKR
jgi:membrane associated rhomboid family serine protease